MITHNEGLGGGLRMFGLLLGVAVMDPSPDPEHYHKY